MLLFKDIIIKHSKDYNTLQNVNLQINKGEKVAIVGDDNSGKHSLARLVSKEEKQTSGELFVNGKSVENVNYKTDVSIGYLKQQPIFFNNKTVKENLSYVLNVRLFPQQKIESVVEGTIKKYNLNDIADIKIKKLSNYEKTTVAIARLDMREIDILVIEDVVGLKNYQINRKKGLTLKHSAKSKKELKENVLDFENVFEGYEIDNINKKIQFLLNAHSNATVLLFCQKNNKLLKDNNFNIVNLKYGTIEEK